MRVLARFLAHLSHLARRLAHVVFAVVDNGLRARAHANAALLHRPIVSGLGVCTAFELALHTQIAGPSKPSKGPSFF